MIVAIDGPAGAGKTSVASAVARVLGFDHLDTGALYRTATLAALDRGVELADGPALGGMTRDISIRAQDESVFLDGVDVTAAIRAPEVTAAVSAVSAHPEVRAALVPIQRSLVSGDVVMEGRDIGSVIFPDAEVKVFLTASLPERARRRALELGWGDDDAAVARAQELLAARDDADSTRSASPLTQAADAVVLDTTGRGIEEVVERIVAAVRSRAHPRTRR